MLMLHGILIQKGERMRRTDRETTREEAWHIFDQSAYSVLSMSIRDIPYATALSVTRMDETLYFHCARDGEKIKAMRENPNVCLHSVAHMKNCAKSFTVYYASCTIRGIAQEVVDETERHRALLALCRTFIPESMDMSEQEIRDLRSVTAVWKITVQEITGKRNVEK